MGTSMISPVTRGARLVLKVSSAAGTPIGVTLRVFNRYQSVRRARRGTAAS